MKLRQRYLLFLSLIAAVAMVSCKGDKEKQPQLINQVDASDLIKGDSMVYGLACDGTNDSSIVVYPFSGGDPVTYSCIDATRQKQVFGAPQIGDWVGLVLDKEDSTVATMVINLDQLKGTWTYPVMPTLKDFEHLSKRMQKRMQREALENMPDSVKDIYFVPREYGFTLKRSHVAQAVGRVFSGHSLEDDSPVKYPEVSNYCQWFPWNGKLILVSTTAAQINVKAENSAVPVFTFDTLSFVSLTSDSLVLMHNGTKYGFHRKENSITANAHATKKAEEANRKAVESLK